MIFDPRGRRKYLTRDERHRFIQVAMGQPVDVRAFCLTIAMTGCRLSEALQLTAAQLDSSAGEIVVRSLKKRRRNVFRAVPVPQEVLTVLNQAATRSSDVAHRIWPWCRATAWKRVKEVFYLAGIEGVQASPKGLRHGFAVAALQSGVPLNLVQRWLGHADIATTAIYTNVLGAEERELAGRLWRATPLS